jgi:hypothetical protein
LITEQKKQVLDLFSEGRKNYKLMNFAEAKKCFSKALEVDPNDGPSKHYMERCDELIQDPPPPDWDGVYVMKTK